MLCREVSPEVSKLRDTAGVRESGEALIIEPFRKSGEVCVSDVVSGKIPTRNRTLPHVASF